MSSKRRKEDERERLRAAFWAEHQTATEHLADTYEARAAYEQESLSLQILYRVQEYMETNGITQQALASALGVTEGRVSQILSGEQNLTLKTLASVAAGLKAHFDVQLLPNVHGHGPSRPRQQAGPGHEDFDLPTQPQADPPDHVWLPDRVGVGANR